ncbi:MAG: glgA4 [Myxococcales bacterium]|nr:glgA4 [Myxococcales bacterium]
MISTPFVSVPPRRYGGTELIVAELVTGLAAAGHEVTLYATGDSQPPPGVTLHARFDEPVWPPQPYAELDHAAWSVDQILGDARFDVVHAHVPSALAFSAMFDAPLVYTVHHDSGEDYRRVQSLYRRSRAQFVAISHRQRELLPDLADARVIHHGLDSSRYQLGRGDGGYCAFLGRFAREKGPHDAIDAAQAAGLPIRLAGAPHWRDSDYFDRELSSRLRQEGVVHVGELGGADKRDLLAGASAMLFPIAWEEPFGLVMIEAMLSGTPVLALPRGSVPEVVEDGVTGFICRDVDDMAARLRDIDRFDRAACRRRALERWSAARMVRDYVAVYEQLQTWVGDVRAAETVA